MTRTTPTAPDLALHVLDALLSAGGPEVQEAISATLVSRLQHGCGFRDPDQGWRMDALVMALYAALMRYEGNTSRVWGLVDIAMHAAQKRYAAVQETISLLQQMDEEGEE